MVKAIQIIGTQRSGSNLLRVMLNQSPEISAPHPPHILKTFYPLLHQYDDLNKQDNFVRLIDDVCTYVELNPVPWKGITLNREAVRARCAENSLLEVFSAIYSMKAEAENANYWCCKSLYNMHYVDEFEKSGMEPYYIYLYRDGRDVALSFKKAIVGEKHIYHIAKQWQADQEIARGIVDKIGAGRALPISYEQLIHDPENTAKQICGFLQIEYIPEMLSFYTSQESENTARSGEMWKNVTKPIMRNNSNKFIKEMSYNDILIFESIAANTLKKLNYQTQIVDRSDEKVFSNEDIDFFSAENERLKRIAQLKVKKEDLLKRERQQQFVKNMKVLSDVTC